MSATDLDCIAGSRLIDRVVLNAHTAAVDPDSIVEVVVDQVVANRVAGACLDAEIVSIDRIADHRGRVRTALNADVSVVIDAVVTSDAGRAVDAAVIVIDHIVDGRAAIKRDAVADRPVVALVRVDCITNEERIARRSDA
jgi:hypothetical protein